jgi:hypothetical protein
MIQLRQAFFLASTPSLVEVPVVGRQILALLAPGGAAPGPLAEKLAFNEKVSVLLEHKASERIVEVELELQRHQLAAPARPTTAESFAPWRNAIITTVLAAIPAGTPASLTFVLGLQVGEALLAESGLATALSMLTVAPGHPALTQEATTLATRLHQATAQLAKLVALPLATPAIHELGGQLVAALDAAPDLRPEGVDAARAAAVRDHQGQVDALRLALLAALPADAPPTLLVPPFLLGYLPTATGTPFQGLDLLAQLERGAAPALLARSQQLASDLRAGNRDTATNVLAVEAVLRHLGLAVPPRPQTAEEYFAWLGQIRQAAPRAVDSMSPAGGALLLGFFLADLTVTLQVGLVALRMLEAAPEHAPVLAQVAASTKGLGGARVNFEQALRHPATPEPALAIGRRLAERFAQAPALDAPLPVAARRQALEEVDAELTNGKDLIVAVLVQAQQIPA